MIKALHEKLKTKEDQEKERDASEQEETLRLESVTEANQEVISALQDKTEQLEANLEAVCTELESNRREMQRVAEERNRMLKLQDETVRFLLTSMQDISEEVARNKGAPAPSPGNLDDMTAKQRQNVLRHLLNKLYEFQTSLKDRTEPELESALPPIHRGPLAALGVDPDIGVGSLQAIANASPAMFGKQQGRVKKAYVTSQMSSINSFGDSQQQPVDASGRPWGSRARNIPLTHSKGPSTFLRRGGGSSGAGQNPGSSSRF